MCNYFSLCVGCKYFLFVNIFVKKKKIYFALCVRMHHLHSNVDTGLRSNSLAFVRPQRPISHTHPCTSAFERTLYVQAKSPLYTHTFSMNAIKRTWCVQSRASLALHLTLLGHCFFPFSPFSPPRRTVPPPPPCSLFPQTP
jgi:hypothetical protein